MNREPGKARPAWGGGWTAKQLRGPALIEERESTCVIGPSDRVRVDERLNLIADLGQGGDGA